MAGANLNQRGKLLQTDWVSCLKIAGRSSPSGGKNLALLFVERPSGREDGRTKKWRPAKADPRIDSCLQAAFLAFGGVAFAAGFGASLAFSFAANSCLTLSVIASTSTLYAVVASRST